MSQDPANAPLIDRQAYRFQTDLSDAIADYIHELTRTQFRALSYRGAYFGRAVALNLYFRLVNDPQLRAAHARMLAGETLSEDPDAIPVGTMAYWILRQMLGRAPGTAQDRSLKARVKRWRTYVEKSRAMGLDHLRAPGRLLQPCGPVLILALSRRFFDYLAPVREALGPDTAWLVPAGTGWAQALQAQGERIVLFGEETGQQPESPLTDALADHWCALAVRFDVFHRVLAREKPAAVVMTEGNQPDDEILARAAQVAGVRSVCIQQGWSPVIHTGFRAMRYDDFCVWGAEFSHLLQTENPDQHFSVTGSHRIEPTQSDRPQNERAVSFFLQKNSLMITERAWQGMLDFVYWTAMEWPRREVLVREHPAEPLTASERARLEALPNVRLCPSASISLDSMLRRTGIAVAFFSTTLVEALAYEAVPLIINITGSPHYVPDLAAMGAGIEVQDFDVARVAMTRLCAGVGPSPNPGILGRFFANGRAQALRSIATVATGR